MFRFLSIEILIDRRKEKKVAKNIPNEVIITAITILNMGITNPTHKES